MGESRPKTTPSDAGLGRSIYYEYPLGGGYGRKTLRLGAHQEKNNIPKKKIVFNEQQYGGG